MSPTTVDRSGCTASRHGTYTAYQRYKCRCPDAREDWRLYYKRWREGRARQRLYPRVGIVRRIRALMAIGHTSSAIAAAVGCTAYMVQQVVHNRRADSQVSPQVAGRILRAYTLLSDTPGPSEQTRRRAERAGWARPIDWDDDTIDDPTAQPAGAAADPGGYVDQVAVDQALARKRRWSQLNPAERRRAIDQLRAAGAKTTRICNVLRISKTTLDQHDAAVQLSEAS